MPTVEVRYGETVAQANARAMGASESEVQSLAPPPAGSGLAGSFPSSGGGSSESAPSISQPQDKLPSESSTEYAYRLHPEEYGGNVGNVEQQRLAHQANILYSRGGYYDVSQEARSRIAYGDAAVEREKAAVRARGGGTEELTYAIITPGAQITTGTQGVASKVYAGRIKALAMGDPEGMLTSGKGVGDVREISREESMRLSPDTTIAIERGFAFSPTEIGIASDRDTAQKMSADIKLERERNPPKYYARFEERYQDQTADTGLLSLGNRIQTGASKFSERYSASTESLFTPHIESEKTPWLIKQGLRLDRTIARTLGLVPEFIARPGETAGSVIGGVALAAYAVPEIGVSAGLSALSYAKGRGMPPEAYTQTELSRQFFKEPVGTSTELFGAGVGFSLLGKAAGVLKIGTLKTLSEGAPPTGAAVSVKSNSMFGGLSELLKGKERDVTVTDRLITRSSSSAKVVRVEPRGFDIMKDTTPSPAFETKPSSSKVELKRSQVGGLSVFDSAESPLKTKATAEPSSRVMNIYPDVAAKSPVVSWTGLYGQVGNKAVYGVGLSEGKVIFGKPKQTIPEGVIPAPLKISDILYSGKEFVPAEKIVEPKILSGEQQFPTSQKSGRGLKHEFDIGTFRLPGESSKGGWHATTAALATKTKTQIGTSESPGFYLSPSLSKYFLRTGSGEGYSVAGVFDKPTGAPSAIWLKTGGTSRIPKGVRRGGFERMNEWLKTGAEKGKGYVSPAFERGKMEKEAIVPPETPITRTSGGRLSHFDSYTIIDGVRTPIKVYEGSTRGGMALGNAFKLWGKESERYYGHKEPIFSVEKMAKGYGARSTKAPESRSSTKDNIGRLFEPSYRGRERQRERPYEPSRREERRKERPFERLFEGISERPRERKGYKPLELYERTERTRERPKPREPSYRGGRERPTSYRFKPKGEEPFRPLPMFNVGWERKAKRRTREDEGSFFRKLKVNPMASPSEVLIGKGELSKKQIMNEEAWAW